MSAALDNFRSPRVHLADRFAGQTAPRADAAPHRYVLSVRERSERADFPASWFAAPLTPLDIPVFPGAQRHV